MKIREMQDYKLQQWMQNRAELNSLNLPDDSVQRAVCNFIRTNFGGLDQSDLDKAFDMWMLGELPNARRRGNQLDAYLLGQILGEYRRGSNGIYDNADGKEDRLSRSEEYLKEENERLSKEFIGLLKHGIKPEWDRMRRICNEGRNFTYGEIVGNLDAHRFGAAFGEWWNQSQENKNLIMEQI